MIQLLPGIRIKEPFRHSTYGRVKVKTIQLFLGKYTLSDKTTKGQNVFFVGDRRQSDCLSLTGVDF